MSTTTSGSRISEEAFTAGHYTFLALALIAAYTKIAYKLYRTKSLSADDIILIVATILLTATVVVFHYAVPIIYQIFVTDTAFDPRKMLKFTKLVHAANVLAWSTIFTVKISFIWFFRGLVDRLPKIRLWWRIVFGLVLVCAPVNMFMTFYMCSNFTLNLSVCAVGIVQRQAIILYLTAALDILTDALVLSIPITLLWKVHINLRRKLALATVLCLSSFMIVIAIIRVAFAFVPNSSSRATTGGAPPGAPPNTPGRPNSAPTAGPTEGHMPTGPQTVQVDQTWQFFWLNIEAAVAIIMVALTAFRSTLGRQSQASKAGKGYHPYNSSGHSAGGAGAGAVAGPLGGNVHVGAAKHQPLRPMGEGRGMGMAKGLNAGLGLGREMEMGTRSEVTGGKGGFGGKRKGSQSDRDWYRLSPREEEGRPF